jgi:hypothetical protein
MRTHVVAMAACLLVAGPGFGEGSLAEKARGHWAFQSLRTPPMPGVRQRDRAQTAVDAFVLAKLEAAGLTPAPPADRRTLLRRVTLDLTGLPPSLEEQDTFLADASPLAYRRLVDRLLASPAYGEGWGRHWLDVARYADTNGYERDGDKPQAWRYRDWVINALNRDLRYDRFVIEQIAGDEAPGTDASAQVATTFLRLGTWDDEPANDAVDRCDQLDDVLGTTCAAFLAQTVRCARCHDHFFEPYSQKDYYRLLVVFTPLKRPQIGRKDLTRPVGTREELAAWERTEVRLDAVLRQAEEIRARAQARGGPPPLAEREKLARLDGEVARPGRSSGPPRAYVWYEEGPRAPETRILRRGNPELLGPVVAPGLPTALAPVEPPPPQPLARSTGRRLWLASWIASPANPLTARVIVNRVWQWHFGQGLVGTANDFGLQGEPPTHPELLDWLATELIRSGWSLKHLHRLIVLSSTYQTSSLHEDATAPAKLALYGRWRKRRLEAEAVRDSMLAVSGQLHRPMGGPGVYPPLPVAVLRTQSLPGLGWGRSERGQAARRSVYVFAKRTLAPPELELLDAPDTNASCEARPRSTTAPQALTFLNGAFANEQARHFAERLLREAGDAAGAQVRLAFRLALGRPPRADEIHLATAFLDRQYRQIEAERPGAPGACRKALEALCLVLLNTNEFFYLG